MLSIKGITSDPNIMGGKACVKDTRITVSLILNLIANGMTKGEVVKEYPALDVNDINECLNYAAYLAEEELYLIQKS